MDSRIYLYIIVILFGLSLIALSKQDHGSRKIYVILITTLLVLESSLRSVYVGPDTYQYYTEFMSVKTLTWDYIWRCFGYAYIDGSGKDPGFHVLIKFFLNFSDSFNLFLLLIALIFFVPLGKILYENTTSIWQLMFAFVLYIALFHIIALSGIRQQIATGGCFMAYLCLNKNKPISAVIILLVSTTFHVSASIFFLMVGSYFLFLKKEVHVEKQIHFASLLLIPVMLVSAKGFMGWLASFLANDYYAVYSEKTMAGGAETFVLLMELLSLICFICIKKEILLLNKSYNLLYATLPMTTLFAPLIMLDGAMIRLVQYFSLFMMLLFPISIDLKFKSASRSIYVIAIIILLVLSLSNSFHYTFFWELDSAAML